MTPLAAYALLFLAVGVGFIFVHLVAGRFIRPARPDSEKGTIYECGEPTIGTAWIQFDLRFYVVALLFVIFDVEVAFFFPWAEVFGKANAVANDRMPAKANAPGVKAAQYNALADKVLDLALPVSASSSQVAYQRWEKLRVLSAGELEAYQQLKPEQVRYLRTLSGAQLEGLGTVSAAQWEKAVGQFADLEHTFEVLRQEQEKALEPFLARREVYLEELQKQVDAGQLPLRRRQALQGQIPILNEMPEKVKAELDRDGATLRLTSLARLEEGGVRLLSFARQAPPSPAPPSPLLGVLRAIDAEGQKKLEALAVEQQKRLAQKGGAVLKQLQEGAADLPDEEREEQAALWPALSVALVNSLRDLKGEQVRTLGRLTPEGLQALDDPVVDQVRQEARTFAWMALAEVVVFFGVLLVGFAYLWRRGDLNWVRSVAAERQAEQQAGVEGQPRPLEMVGPGRP